jgi:hypothetical protein
MKPRAPWIHSLGPLVVADLRQRYAGSLLGASWAVLAPLIEAATYGVVFGLVLGMAGQATLPYAVLIAAGPNTLFDGQLTGRLDGRYSMTATFEDLPLLRGSYQASVSLYDRDHVYAYAWHHRLYPFTVLSDQQDHGLVLLRHRFELRPIDSSSGAVGA